MSYLFHLGIYFCIYAIAAMGLNIVVGYCGLLTMAHAGYFAIGCYVYALAALQLGLSFLPATAMAVGVTALLSLAISLPAWRLKDDFFVLISLCTQVLLFSLIYNWYSPNREVGSLDNLTNGPFGIGGISKPSLFGVRVEQLGSLFLLFMAIAALCALVCYFLLSSPWGRLLKSMRDDELAARGLGKNTRLAKVQALAVACGMAGLAGSLYASYVSYIDPSAGSLGESVLLLCMVIVGGVGNFYGPLVGVIVLLAIPEALRYAEVPVALAGNLRLLIFGLLLIIMMHFRPQGIAGEYRVE